MVKFIDNKLKVILILALFIATIHDQPLYAENSLRKPLGFNSSETTNRYLLLCKKNIDSANKEPLLSNYSFLFDHPQKFRDLILDRVRVDPLSKYHGKSDLTVYVTKYCPVGCSHCYFNSQPLDKNKSSPKEKGRLTDEGIDRTIEFTKHANLGSLVITGGGEPLTETKHVFRLVEEAKADIIIINTSGFWAQDRKKAEKIIEDLYYALKRRKEPARLVLRLSADEFHAQTLTLQPALNLIAVFQERFKDNRDFQLLVRSLAYDSVMDSLLAQLSVRDVQEGGIYRDNRIRYPSEKIVTLSSGYNFTIITRELVPVTAYPDLNDSFFVDKMAGIYDREMQGTYHDNTARAIGPSGQEDGTDMVISWNGDVMFWGESVSDNRPNIYMQDYEEITKILFDDVLYLSFLEKGISYRDRIVQEVNPRAVARQKAYNIRTVEAASAIYDETKTRLYLSVRILQDYLQEGRIQSADLMRWPEELRYLVGMNREALARLYHESARSIVDDYLDRPGVTVEDLVTLYKLVTLGHYDISAEHMRETIMGVKWLNPKEKAIILNEEGADTPSVAPFAPVRMLLVNIVNRDKTEPVYPIGLYTLKAFIENNYPGMCDVEVKDVQLDDTEDIVEFLKEWRPQIAGLSLKTENLGALDEFMQRLKTSVSIEDMPLCVVGRNIPTFAYRELLEKYPEVVCSISAGELATGGLLEYVLGRRSLRDVPNIAYKDNDTVVVTEKYFLRGFEQIGIIDYSTVTKYVSGFGSFWMETSRGCPWGRCKYCCLDKIWERPGRMNKPIPMIVQELKRLQKLGIKNITLSDEEFFGPGTEGIKRAKRLAQAILDSGIKVSFYMVDLRADSIYNKKDQELRIETLRLLKQAGLKTVFIGVETGSPSQMKRYGKGLTVETCEGAIRILREIGIDMVIGSIFIEPLVSRKELLESVDFIKRNRITPYVSAPLNMLRVYATTSYIESIREEEKRLGRKFISEAFDLNTLTYKIIDCKDRDVKVIVDMVNRYTDTEYDLYNAIKWFERYFHNLSDAGSSEFAYIKEALVKHREAQIDFLSQLASLNEKELLHGEKLERIFATAVAKRNELFKNLDGEIQQRGHMDECGIIVTQIQKYFASETSVNSQKTVKSAVDMPVKNVDILQNIQGATKTFSQL